MYVYVLTSFSLINKAKAAGVASINSIALCQNI